MGPRFGEIIDFSELDLDAAISAIMTIDGIPDPPVVFRDDPEDEPDVPLGQTWVYAGRHPSIHLWRKFSLVSWFSKWLSDSEVNLQAQLTLFWTNHFAISHTSDFRMVYKRIELFQRHGLGNMRDMIKEMAVDPGMLEFLNGNENFAGRPNENFAREFLELYSIGKGPEVSPGDYTTFTEEDVRAVARIMTGWEMGEFLRSPTPLPIEGVFDPERHDPNPKQLSHRFNNAVIDGYGPTEYQDLIDVVFDQFETARKLTRDIYRWFVGMNITEQTEREVIEPLATLLYQSDYELRPMLRELLSSAHFFNTTKTDAVIKHPMDYQNAIFRPLRGLQHVDFETLEDEYYAHRLKYSDCQLMQMDWLEPPTVAGWTGYHQRPGYYRNWISASSLQLRKQRMEFVTGFHYSINYDNNLIILRLNYRDFLADLSDPNNINAVIQDTALTFLCRPLSPGQRSHLRNKLMAESSPDIFYHQLYQEYVDFPDSTQVAFSFERRIRTFLQELFTMVEFQLK